MQMNPSAEAEINENYLVKRIREGDNTAWEKLVQAHQQPVFRLSYLLLGDAADAEDNAQETFLRAWRALDRFDAARSLRPWLLSIAANLARNRRRSSGRYIRALRRLVVHLPQGSEPASSAWIEERTEQSSRSKILWRAVQALPYDHQKVIYLRFFLDMSVEETAQTLGTAPGTVKSRLHRALNRLRQVIDSDYPTLKEWLE